MDVVDNVPLEIGTTGAATLPMTVDYTMISEDVNVGSGVVAVCSAMPVKPNYLKVKINGCRTFVH